MLRQVAAGCGRALDVGCGDGVLTAKLAERARRVTGIDASPAMIARARAVVRYGSVDFIEGDFLSTPLPPGSFDFIAAVASLHHMALEPALLRMAQLLRPGGVIAVVGLARNVSPLDWTFSALSVPVAKVARRRRGWWESPAPAQDPTLTLAQVSRAAATILPGVEVRRRLYFRHTLLWRKP